MGCVSSKQAVSVTPEVDHSGPLRSSVQKGKGLDHSGRVQVSWPKVLVEPEGEEKKGESLGGIELGESGRLSCNGESGRFSNNGESVSFRLGNMSRYVEGEQVAAGWPPWLSAVAGEAIRGWVPLKADTFEKLEKIGQGTYSTVFKARDLETGRMVALKKVRFDTFEPESIRFMAREIIVLRRLNHPNIIKLEGIITSRLSCSIYLVFEYMEHDLTGLLSCADMKFTEPQIKCHMKQLLAGIEHCHSQGVMHRDIKGSNLLINNEGILKVADFGLANFYRSRYRQPLTSRVVTLWYRPPELLLGSTYYDASVDLWSVGCVFGELLTGQPILQGRTEVEQLHKIFKLCGSPPDNYWNKTKFPHATLFKPQQQYDSSLHESFKHLPETAVNLIKTLLSVEPHERGTASLALLSEYFRTKPLACDPSSLPTFPPCKEIDVKIREETKRKKGGRVRGTETTKKAAGKAYRTRKTAPPVDLAVQPEVADQSSCGCGHIHILKEENVILDKHAAKQTLNTREDSQTWNASQGELPFSGPLQVSSSSSFSSFRSHKRSDSRGNVFNVAETSAAMLGRSNFGSNRHEFVDPLYGIRTNSRDRDSYENLRKAIKPWGQIGRHDSFDISDRYHSQELSLALYQREEMEARKSYLDCQDQQYKGEFSGPLLSQTHKVDEHLQRNERNIRQAVRKSWFQRARKLRR